MASGNYGAVTAGCTNVSLRDCIRLAYGIKEFEVQGPDRLATTRFDILAKLPNGASEQQVPAMLQALLSDRFNLVAHMEKREHAVYALVADKGGAKLKKAEVEASGTAGPTPSGAGRMAITADPAGAHVRVPSSTLVNFADVLSRFTDRPVVDATGIEGQYDFELVTSLEAVQHLGGAQPALETPADILDSIQRFGLKLDARKIPTDVLVVDRMERSPSEN